MLMYCHSKEQRDEESLILRSIRESPLQQSHANVLSFRGAQRRRIFGFVVIHDSKSRAPALHSLFFIIPQKSVIGHPTTLFALFS